jgi:XisI protein
MAELEQCRNWVQQLLTEYAARRSSQRGEVELQTLFDQEHDHYQLIYVGWEQKRRVFGPVMHLDIRAGKVWIQWNGTEETVGDDLVELGLSKQDIVLGFHPESMRKFTEFAVS